MMKDGCWRPELTKLSGPPLRQAKLLQSTTEEETDRDTQIFQFSFNL